VVFSQSLSNLATAMDIRFDGRTALVTGSGRGIGRALAEKLSQLGAKVLAVSRSEKNLESLKIKYPEIITIQVDLTNWEETVSKLKEQAGTVDLLVNNAAASNSELIGNIEEDSIDTMFGVNYKACVNLIQLVSGGMKSRRFGSIVNVSSVSGISALDGHCIYGSTKSAVDMLTKIACKEFGKYNIRVNSINPTVVWTDMGQAFWSDEEKHKEMVAKIPMGRFVKIEEVVDPILFLLSSHAAMISGVQLPVDGGFTAT